MWPAVIVRLLIALRVAGVSDVGGTPSMPASRSSVAAVSGNQVVIPCSSTAGASTIYWIRQAMGDTNSSGIRIVSGCVSLFESRYQVVRSQTASSCDLVIVNVNSSDTGQYVCADSDSKAVSAFVTVLSQCVFVDASPLNHFKQILMFSLLK